MRTVRAAWLFGWLVLCAASAALGETGVGASCASDGCPPAFTIGDLDPDFTDVGDTCDGAFGNDVGGYSRACRIGGVDYSGPDAVYAIQLTEGNSVAFSLTQTTGDLVLVLGCPVAVGNEPQCGDGDPVCCQASSPDFIDPVPEEIQETTYPPGLYPLYVDSARGAPCGRYVLEVTGTNPAEPDLALRMNARPDPVVAGTKLTYTFTVVNDSPFSATGVTVATTLPAGVWPEPSLADQGCTGTLPGPITCPVGNVGRGEIGERTFTVMVDPSYHVDFPGQEPLTLEARVAAAEPDRTEGNDTATATTRVIARADVLVRKTASPEPVAAGEELRFRVEVGNAGPSTATGIVVTDEVTIDGSRLDGSRDCVSLDRSRLPPACDVTFEDPCRRIEIVCEVSRLLPDPDRRLAGVFRIGIDPSFRGELSNRAEIRAAEDEPEPKGRTEANNEAVEDAPVRPEADLTVDLEAPSTAVAGGDVAYELEVMNFEGPSTATDVAVRVDLPEGVRLTMLETPCPSGMPSTLRCVSEGERRLRCDVERLEPDGLERTCFTARIDPSLPRDTFDTMARFLGRPTEEDPDFASNQDTESTDVTRDVQLSLEKAGVPGRVTPGGLLFYLLTVTNDGASDARNVVVTDDLAATLTCKAVLGCPGAGCPAQGRTITCPLGSVPGGSSAELVVTTEVSDTVGAGETIENEARVTSDDSGEIEAEAPPVEVEVPESPDPPMPLALDASDDVPSLVVPRFRIDPETPDGETTRFAVRNGAEPPVVVRIDYLDDEGASLRPPQLRPLPPRAMERIDLVDDVPFPSFPTSAKRGSVRLTVLNALGEPMASPAVGGDFVHVEAGGRAASGSRLLRRSDLECTRWSTGLFRNDLLGGTTGSSVLSPGSAGTQWELGGEVFDFAGREVAQIGRESRQDSFQIPLRSSARSMRNVPVDEGSIEWTLGRPGVVFFLYGNQTGGPTFGAPGACLEPRRDAASRLVAPSYQLDPGGGGTTRFLVRNTDPLPTAARVECFDPTGDPKAAVDLDLPGHASRDVDLGTEPILAGSCPAAGFVRITGPDDVLAGEYVLLPAGDTAHGEALLDGERDGARADLCRRWDQRFLQPPEASTEVLFYTEDADGEADSEDPLLVGTVFDEDGGIVRNPDGSVQRIEIDRQEVAFRLSVGDLDLPIASGVIEWRFRNDKIGHVAYLLESGDTSVLIPAVCRDLGSSD